MLAKLADDFGGVANLPSHVRFSDYESGGWHGQEQEFAKAVSAGNWIKAQDVRDAYLKRVEAFCDRSRAKFLTKGAA